VEDSEFRDYGINSLKEGLSFNFKPSIDFSYVEMTKERFSHLDDTFVKAFFRDRFLIRMISALKYYLFGQP
jgi:hypothetical protein